METNAGGHDLASAMDEPRAQAGPRAKSAYLRAWSWVQSESLLVAILLGTFLARLLVADRNSYWLDEIYSVTIHGSWNESVTELVRVLANGGVYPPVYFVGLYEWMNWFGTTEFTTRLPSNVFIMLATLFLYLALRVGLSRRVGLTAIVVFSLLYTSTFYGLEARPYAISIFLVTLSSYLLLRLYRDGAGKGWRLALVSPTGSMFVLTNATLLLTHVYNLFFWLAQGLIVLVFVLRESRAQAWLKGLGAVGALYGMQAAIFVGVWGRALLRGVDRFGGAYAIDEEGELRNPLLVLSNGLIEPNIDPPGFFAWIGIGLLVMVAVGAIVGVSRRRSELISRSEHWTVLYLITWLVMPFLIVYLVFLVLGVARYSNRYFVFSVVPLAPLIVLALDEIVLVSGRLAQKLRGGKAMSSGWHHRWAILLAIVTIITLILPRTLAAATNPKDDWRGTAESIVEIIESDPESSYVIYEPAFRSVPVLDYYLARFSDEIRVTDVIQRREERGERPFAFMEQLDAIEEHDFLILPFIHHSTRNFPRALEMLTELYEIHLWQVSPNGKGLVILALSPEDPDS